MKRLIFILILLFSCNSYAEWGGVNSKITGDSGKKADVIAIDGHDGLVTISPGYVSTTNSTSETLAGDAQFSGTWEDVTNCGVIVITVIASHASATDGLCIQFSSDGTNIDSTDAFMIPANIGKTFSFQAATKYYRVMYTNGSTIQTSFRLQTMLKPYYVKPSSHRVADAISDQDDAELITNVNKGLGDLSGTFDNVTTYRGVMNVNSAWVHRKIVNETFHQHDGTTSLNSAATAGDTSISVDDTTGFIVGDEIKLEETVAGVGFQEIGLMTITIVAAGTPGTLTLDRPLGFDYTTAAVASNVESNMTLAVGTLASPQIYEIYPPPGTVWQFTRVLFSITDATAPDDGKFGGMLALTNGVSLRATTESGRTVIFGNWKTNGDMKLDMYDVTYTDKALAGNHGVNGRWTFTRAEVVAELNGDADPVQKLEVLIQDDLTDLITFTMRAQGRVFSP